MGRMEAPCQSVRSDSTKNLRLAILSIISVKRKRKKRKKKRDKRENEAVGFTYRLELREE